MASNNHPSRARAARKRREATGATTGDTCQPVPQVPPARHQAPLGPTIRRVGEAAADLAEAIRGLSVEEVGRVLERADQDFDLVLLEADAAHLAGAIL